MSVGLSIKKKLFPYKLPSTYYSEISKGDYNTYSLIHWGKLCYFKHGEKEVEKEKQAQFLN